MQEGKMLRINGTWKKNRTVVCVYRVRLNAMLPESTK